MAQFRELTDHYRLEKILSSSRSATVLKGTELLTGRSVAIKMINIADPAGLTAGAARFSRLAEVIKGLAHRNFPLLLDSGFTTEGSAFLVTELLSGARFEALAGAPPDRTLPLLIGAVEGVAALAEAGVTHLNIAPQNLFVTAAEGLEAARLLGLATPVFRPPGAALDGKDETARFRAPEIAAGGPGDGKSDVYSLAMTVCHALGAAVAAEGGGLSVQLPLSLSFDLANAEVLRRILERSLQQSPAARPTPRELRSALRLALGFTEPAAFTEAAPSPPAPKPAIPAAAPAAAPFPPVAPTLSPAARAEPVLPGLEALDLTSLDLSLPSLTAPPRLVFDDDGIPPSPSAFAAQDAPDFFAPGALAFDGFDEPLAPLPTPEDNEADEADFPPFSPLADEPPAFSPPPLAQTLPPLPPLPSAASPSRLEPPAPPPSVTPPAFAAPPSSRPVVAAPPAPSFTPSPAAAPAPRPTPPVAAQEMATDGDVLRSLDDDLLLQPLPPPPTAAPPARGGKAKAAPAPPPRPASPGASAGVASAAGSSRLFGLPRWLVLTGFAGFALLLLLAGAVWWQLQRSAAPVGDSLAGEPPPPTAPPPPPKVPPTAKIQQAIDAYATQKQDYKAWQILQTISFGEQGTLSPDQCRAVAALESSLSLTTLEHLPADLARGVSSGDLDELRGMEVAANRLAPSLAALPPEAQEGLSKIKSVLVLYAAAQTAAAARKPEEVLDRLAAAKAAVPNLTDPADLRNKAAESILTQGAALARDGKYDEAIARLEPLRRTWSDRPGLTELVTSYETAKRLGQEQEALLATLPNYERRRKPHEGLAAIRSVQPVPHLEAKFAEARQRLENQLNLLDGRPPQVVLRDGYSLIYSRGTVANLSFRVSDDYEVVSVRMMAAPEGGKMRNYPLERARNGAWYTAEIRPEFHHNGTVRFFVLATDVSGHEGTLGSASQPLELKRSGDLGLRR